MARVQVLPLPGTPDDPAPFVLIFDELADTVTDDFWPGAAADMKTQTGARHVIVSFDRLDVV